MIFMSLVFVRSVGRRSGGHHGACVKCSKKQSKVVGCTRYDDFDFNVGISKYFGGQKSSAVVLLAPWHLNFDVQIGCFKGIIGYIG